MVFCLICHLLVGQKTKILIYFIVHTGLLGMIKFSVRTTIGVVDDELDLAELYTEALRRSGYEVISFSDSLVALEEICLNHSKYAMVIADIRMPKLNGIELITQLRHKDEMVKFLLISGFGQLYQSDFHYPFLEKPFKMALFVDLVNTILKPKQMKSSKEWRVTLMPSVNEVEETKSDLKSLGLQPTKLNLLNDSYELEHLVDNLKQQFIRDYKSASIFTD
jgi:DNA-binding response OmpR family regulator